MVHSDIVNTYCWLMRTLTSELFLPACFLFRSVADSRQRWLMLGSWLADWLKPDRLHQVSQKQIGSRDIFVPITCSYGGWSYRMMCVILDGLFNVIYKLSETWFCGLFITHHQACKTPATTDSRLISVLCRKCIYRICVNALKQISLCATSLFLVK